MENAASALLLGWDPIEYLRLSGPDRIIADAVLKRAGDLRSEELTSIVKGIGNSVGHTVAQMLR